MPVLLAYVKIICFEFFDVQNIEYSGADEKTILLTVNEDGNFSAHDINISNATLSLSDPSFSPRPLFRIMNAVDNMEVENITIRNNSRRLVTTVDNAAISNIRISGLRMCDAALGTVTK